MEGAAEEAVVDAANEEGAGKAKVEIVQYSPPHLIISQAIVHHHREAVKDRAVELNEHLPEIIPRSTNCDRSTNNMNILFLRFLTSTQGVHNGK